jgi:hypothetical protein
MGILDRLKGQASGLKQKATEAVDKNSDKIHAGIDKAGDFVDKKTKGKYSDKIDKAKGAAEKGLDKLDRKQDDFAPEHSHEHTHGPDTPHTHPHDHTGEHSHEHPAAEPHDVSGGQSHEHPHAEPDDEPRQP